MTNRVRAALVAFPVLLAYPGYLYAVGTVGGNFHEVIRGTLYRSAQLSGPLLDRTIREHRIASVLNLRGGHAGEGFYDDEIDVCRKLNVRHVDVPISALKLPSPEKAQRILDALDKLPKPILVHCRAGADRTGFAVALYGVALARWPLSEARSRGLSWRYGHLGIGRSVAMDRFFDLYAESGGREGVREWIVRRYPKVYAKAVDARRREAVASR